MSASRQKHNHIPYGLLIAAVLLLCVAVVAGCAFYWADDAGKEPSLPSEVLSNQPSIASAVDPSGYTQKTLSHDAVYEGHLILVNAQVPYRFPETNRLVGVYDNKSDGYKVKDRNVQVDEDMMGPLDAMLHDFHEATGNGEVLALSGFRTYDYQKTLLANKVNEVGAVEASKWVAPPGGSEHHTGYAMDLGVFNQFGRLEDYTGEGVYSWINQSCYKYGFIVRYDEEKSDLTGVSYEPWHFRFVGKPHAYIMTQQGICMEEYIDYLKQFPFGRQHLQIEDYDGKRYEIYYVKAEQGDTQVPVPTGRAYTLSGNNVDGFIVTVEL